MTCYNPDQKIVSVSIGSFQYKYDIEKSQERQNSLQKNLAKIDGVNIYHSTLSNLEANPLPTNLKDSTNRSNEEELNNLENEIQKLSERSNEFTNPDMHFTREYRSLEGYCGKYQAQLDLIDITENPYLRQRRKDCFKKLQEIVIQLTERVHPNGLVCRNCEIK